MALIQQYPQQDLRRGMTSAKNTRESPSESGSVEEEVEHLKNIVNQQSKDIAFLKENLLSLAVLHRDLAESVGGAFGSISRIRV